VGWIETIEVRPGRGKRRRDGRWIRYKANYRDRGGQKHCRSFDRREDAKRWYERAETDLDRGEWTDPRLRKVLFSDWWVKYLEAHPELRPKTRALYELHMRRYVMPAFGARLLSEISQEAVGEWLAGLARDGVGAPTRAKALSLLGAVMRMALRARRIAWDPTVGHTVKVPKGRRGRALTPEQVEALAEAIDPRYRTLIHLLAYGGVRIGEAAALPVGDFDEVHGTLTIERAVSEIDGRVEVGETKTEASKRNVGLPPWLRTELSEHIAAYGKGGLIFPSPGGGVLRPNNWRRRSFTPAATEAGLSPPTLRPHDLRHTHGTWLHHSGIPLKDAQHRLGHSNSRTTMDIYTHAAGDEEIREALELLRPETRPTEPPAVVSMEGPLGGAERSAG
jgi:integrase